MKNIKEKLKDLLMRVEDSVIDGDKSKQDYYTGVISGVIAENFLNAKNKPVKKVKKRRK